jgi:hypothetical protein
LDSELHRLHESILEVQPQLDHPQRMYLILNKIVVKDEWLFCTLCTMKSATLETLRPHIQSMRHIRRVQWAATEGEEIDAFLKGETIRPYQEPTVMGESKNAERVSFAAKDLRTICYSLQNTRSTQITQEELDLLSEKCDQISRHVRDIKNRCKTLGEERCRLGITVKTPVVNSACVVCLDKDRTRVLIPCRHFALCATCCDSLHPRICPICRLQVTDSIETILS